jgi:predicted Fe-Mo cluster-binding NifX family protein
MEFEGIDNASAGASGGAGTSAAQMVAGKGVEAVLTGNCGPNAYQVLDAAEIKIITGVSGSVRDAAEGYKSGKYQPVSAPSTDAKSGINPGAPGTGGGMGMGRGRGMGGGGGRGMGRGGGMGRGRGMGGTQ